jgi:hypothetical protein
MYDRYILNDKPQITCLPQFLFAYTFSAIPIVAYRICFSEHFNVFIVLVFQNNTPKNWHNRQIEKNQATLYMAQSAKPLLIT